ncbi:hypothetical protein [Microbacterium sp. MYb72]|uniref:hypothetical protein n=1 Tax=Microbacterium sp. MYb72 TaxID=1848693 RepID=UPI00215842A5|nr:hypothetical protein [Microbacterium sp. MYb72]
MGSAGPLTRARVAREAEWRQIRTAALKGPLQSLSDRELDLNTQPITVYPRAAQRRVRAWVRFGPEAVRVDARIVRSTPLAAGIEFSAEETTFRCWVWGNAVTIDDVGDEA